MCIHVCTYIFVSIFTCIYIYVARMYVFKHIYTIYYRLCIFTVSNQNTMWQHPWVQWTLIIWNCETLVSWSIDLSKINTTITKWLFTWYNMIYNSSNMHRTSPDLCDLNDCSIHPLLMPRSSSRLAKGLPVLVDPQTGFSLPSVLSTEIALKLWNR